MRRPQERSSVGGSYVEVDCADLLSRSNNALRIDIAECDSKIEIYINALTAHLEAVVVLPRYR